MTDYYWSMLGEGGTGSEGTKLGEILGVLVETLVDFWVKREGTLFLDGGAAQELEGLVGHVLHGEGK